MIPVTLSWVEEVPPLLISNATLLGGGDYASALGMVAIVLACNWRVGSCCILKQELIVCVCMRLYVSCIHNKMQFFLSFADYHESVTYQQMA